jgi:hypothetical protein
MNQRSIWAVAVRGNTLVRFCRHERDLAGDLHSWLKEKLRAAQESWFEFIEGPLAVCSLIRTPGAFRKLVRAYPLSSAIPFLN